MARSQKKTSPRKRSIRLQARKKSRSEIIMQNQMMRRLDWQITTAHKQMDLHSYRQLMKQLHVQLNQELKGRKSSVRIDIADNDVFHRLDGVLNQFTRRQAHARVDRIASKLSRTITNETGLPLPTQ